MTVVEAPLLHVEKGPGDEVYAGMFKRPVLSVIMNRLLYYKGVPQFDFTRICPCVKEKMKPGGKEKFTRLIPPSGLGTHCAFGRLGGIQRFQYSRTARRIDCRTSRRDNL